MARTNCVYCNKPITTRSSEHVIHNALGGLYESTDICCPECNNYTSKCIDVPFTTIFTPIIGRIDKFSKSRNSNNTSSFPGIVEYNGTQYDAVIRNGRVISCTPLSRQLKCDATKLPLKIVGYRFNLDNDAFKNGMSKIAFNHAIDQGINLNYLKHGIQIQSTDNNVNGITFNYPIIPFMPLNPIDEYLELSVPPTMHHIMILFNHYNTLWCYIDLFNTFQYYVLLSENMPNAVNVHQTYAQKVQKIDHTPPKLMIDNYKDIAIYANKYGVEPCMDVAEFTRRVNNAIAKKSQRMPLGDLMASPLFQMPLDKLMANMPTQTDRVSLMHASWLYMDNYHNLNTDTFRTQTPNVDATEIVSYPYELNDIFATDKKALQKYTTLKFNRLNSILCDKVK